MTTLFASLSNCIEYGISSRKHVFEMHLTVKFGVSFPLKQQYVCENVFVYVTTRMLM